MLFPCGVGGRTSPISPGLGGYGGCFSVPSPAAESSESQGMGVPVRKWGEASSVRPGTVGGNPQPKPGAQPLREGGHFSWRIRGCSSNAGWRVGHPRYPLGMGDGGVSVCTMGGNWGVTPAQEGGRCRGPLYPKTRQGKALPWGGGPSPRPGRQTHGGTPGTCPIGEHYHPPAP